jgi:hypothetical protein
MQTNYLFIYLLQNARCIILVTPYHYSEGKDDLLLLLLTTISLSLPTQMKY